MTQAMVDEEMQARRPTDVNAGIASWPRVTVHTMDRTYTETNHLRYDLN